MYVSSRAVEAITLLHFIVTIVQFVHQPYVHTFRKKADACSPSPSGTRV